MESKILTQITDLIANDQTKEAIGSLQQLLKGNPLLSEVILSSGRYADIKKQIRMGTINFQNADFGKNKIRLALLEMIGELDDKSEKDKKIRAALDIEGSKLNVNQLKAKR